MDAFSVILNYLSVKKFPKTKDALRRLLATTEVTVHANDKNLLKQIKQELKKHQRPAQYETQATMDEIMNRVVTSPQVAQEAVDLELLEKLKDNLAFKKLLEFAGQMFLEEKEATFSDEEEVGHFGKVDGGDNFDAYVQKPEGYPPLQSAQSGGFAQSDDDELFSSFSQQNEANTEESQEGPSFILPDDSEDEYSNDDDLGFDAYECKEEDFAEASIQLAARFNYPERAVRKLKEGEIPFTASPDIEARRRGRPYFPDHIKFPHSMDEFYPNESEGVLYDCFELKMISDREKTGFEETKDLPLLANTVLAGRYQVVEYLGSAAFSKAIQCLDLHTNEMVCTKIIENNKDYVDQSIDEIKILKYIQINGDPESKFFIRMIDYFYHREHLFIVTELLRDNLYEFYKYNREHEEDLYFTIGRIQKVAYQILTALEYIHSLKLIHCDLKPENILIKSYSRCEIKVIDFGSSCYIHDHLSSYVQSRSYRAPEVILGCKYDYKIDIWSVGCILAELWTGNVLFQNETVQGLLARVMGIIGPFPEEMLKTGRLVSNFFTNEKLLYQESAGEVYEADNISDNGEGKKAGDSLVQIMVPKKSNLKARLKTDDPYFYDFVKQLLELNISLRPTATEALKHPFLTKCKYPDGL